jgi:acyl transferase domain-containing protein/phosphopantetheinyl transferase
VNDVRRDAIAIVGMAGVFPGAADVHRYWQNILEKVDATGDPPADWEAELYLDPSARTDDHPYCVRGGYLGSLAEFSPSELGVMPSSVDGTEPDHFLALRAAHEALLDASLTTAKLDATRTEVIVGRGTYVNRGNTTVVQHTVMLDQMVRILKQLHPEHSDSDLAEIRKELKSSLPPFNVETAAGLVPNIITGRIANRLDCMGANYIVDAACASSLVAVDHAIRDLQSGRCDLAIAGGVHASTPPPIVTIFCQLKAISPKGQIRPFDEGADGTLLGEGVGMVVLKRLADAERDGNRIYAVIRGIGVASDGRAVGLLAPRLEGEELALRRAYEAAGVPPQSVGLVEAHGTATTVGDAVEVDALNRVFGDRTGVFPRCALGSVKSMIGHLMPASGIAGLIKAALALHHRVLPPTMHCDRPNAKLALDRSVFYLNTEPRPWIHGTTEPRRAGVNAFGFGGINAHAVLEEYAGTAPAPSSSQRVWDSELCVLSAPSRAALAQEADALAAALENTAGVALKDIAYTANARPFESERLAIIATSTEDLRGKLGRAAAKLRDDRVRRIREMDGVYYFSRPLAREGGLAFAFPGEGSQYPHMLADLCMHFPEVRSAFDMMDRAFAGHPRGYLPSDIVFPRTADDASRLFGMDAGAEAVFTANQGLAALLASLDIRPRAVVGHSTGEHSALLVAGVVSVRDESELRAHVLGVNAVYEQLQSSAGIPEGMLLATGGIDIGVLRQLVDATNQQVHIAMDNCPHQVVLCGTREAIGELRQSLQAHRAICQELPFARAYHTPSFRVFCAPLRAYFERVTVAAPSDVDVYSCVTAQKFPSDPNAIRELVSTQWAESVRFRDTIEAMYRDGVRLFVEVGPRANLTGFIDDILRGREYAAMSANVPHRSGLTQLNHLAGQLVAHGVGVNLARLYEHRAPVTVDWRKPAGPPKHARVRLKTGLQPMRLSESLPRRAPAAVPAAAAAPAPAALPSTPAPAVLAAVPTLALTPPPPSTPRTAVAAARATSAPPVITAHFRTMSSFLDVQARVMGAYLGRGKGTPGTQQSTPPARLAFVDTVIAHEPGRAVTALVRLDLRRHPFLDDHTLGRDIAAEDPGLGGLPVLPLTFSIEILAEAAAALMPGAALIALERIRASRWIMFADPQQTLVVSARVRDGEPGLVDVNARFQGAGNDSHGPVVIQAMARFAPALPPPPIVSRFEPSRARPSAWTPERLYRDGMFHGRAFRAVRSIDSFGEDGVSATLVAPSPRGLFADPAAPELLTEAVLLDAAGQALALWAKERVGEQFDFFPFAVAAIRIYQPAPAAGVPVRCDVRASLVGDDRTICDIDLVDARGRAVYRIEGWEDRRFELPPMLLRLRVRPRDTELGAPWESAIANLVDRRDVECSRVDGIADDVLQANHGIWGEMLAHLILGRRERAQWRAISQIPKRRHEWLLGRLAAKDALRRLLQRRNGIALAPADIEIVPDAHGCPQAAGAWRERLGVTPVVSIAHSGGVAAALAAIDSRVLVGIDIERVTADRDGFEAIAFAPHEQHLVSTLDAEARREWHVRMWCAKEAAGKAIGRGLAGGLSALHVQTADPGGVIGLTMDGDYGQEFPHLRGRELRAVTTRDGDFVASVAVIAGLN